MKNLFKKNQIVLICSFIFLTFLICFSACKKEGTQKSELSLNENKKTDKMQIVEEKVDKQLLEKYVDYELKLEAKNLRSKLTPLTPPIDMSDLRMNKSEFEKMIDNYLANEANIMREEYAKKRNLNVITYTKAPQNPHVCYDEMGNAVPCEGFGGGETVSCTGTFTGMNTTNTILLVAGLNTNSTIIESSGYAFGGFSGEWAPVGVIDQHLSQNVITYKQYYTDTYKSPSGVTYTQIYLLYGNVYNSTCTVHGMKVEPIQ